MPRDHVKSPAVAGRLHNSPVPELLAYALNHTFTGALVLESEGRQRSGVYFEGGLVSRARAAGMEQALARDVLAWVHLADKDLLLAARFARESGCDIFTAVERLALLSQERLESCRALFVQRQVEALAVLPPETVYGFFPELDTLKKTPGPSEPLPGLSTVIASILSEPSLDRVRDQLEPFKNERMAALPATAQDLGGAGVARTVIARLRRAPLSLEELRLLNLVQEHELVACIHALRLTRRIVGEGSPSGRPSLSSRVPRRASSQALRAVREPEVADADLTHTGRDTLPEVGYQPPKLDSEPPRAKYSEAQQKRYWQEQNAESKALEAWAMAEGGDAAALQKAISIVEKAIEFFPNNPQIRFYAGCLYSRARQFDRAATELRKVLSIDPHNIEAKRELELIGHKSAPPPNKGVFGRLLKKR